MRLRGVPTLLLAVTLAVMATAAAGAEDTQAKLSAVKAAYLYNFCLFIEWPSPLLRQPSDTVVIGVAGDGAFLNLVLQATENKRILQHPIKVKKVSKPADLADVQLVFLGIDSMEKLEPFLAEARKLPVVTVGDVPGFAAKGGMIALVLDGERVRYEINLEAARAVNVNIGSKVLSLAKQVYGK